MLLIKKYLIIVNISLLQNSANVAARLAQAYLASKSDIPDFVKMTDIADKLKNLNKILLQIKQNMYMLKMNQMNYQKKLKQNQQKD